MSLNHFSCNDHFIVTNNVYDSIINSNVIFDTTNPSNHNIIYLLFDFTVNFKSALAFNNNNEKSTLLWSKATEYDISNYVNILNGNLNSISISEDLFSCDNCNSIEHRNAIDNLCDSVISSCINASLIVFQ